MRSDVLESVALGHAHAVEKCTHSITQIGRLNTELLRKILAGIPFYFLKIDIAGNVLKRSSATRFQFARFGGPCPLWNVHQAFAQPGQTMVQLAATPEGTIYLCIARTVSFSAGSYLSRPRAVAVGLGCEVAYAGQTVYAKGIDLEDAEAAEPIGPGCRACERTECRHRALPPIGLALDVGTAERGVVPYRIDTKLPKNASLKEGLVIPPIERE
jgi:XRE family transcriptional regulator, fatty acid utilization regulator